jgi:hypothetical protein
VTLTCIRWKWQERSWRRGCMLGERRCILLSPKKEESIGCESAFNCGGGKRGSLLADYCGITCSLLCYRTESFSVYVSFRSAAATPCCLYTNLDLDTTVTYFALAANKNHSV